MCTEVVAAAEAQIPAGHAACRWDCVSWVVVACASYNGNLQGGGAVMVFRVRQLSSLAAWPIPNAGSVSAPGANARETTMSRGGPSTVTATPHAHFVAFSCACFAATATILSAPSVGRRPPMPGFTATELMAGPASSTATPASRPGSRSHYSMHGDVIKTVVWAH